jgi:hypothetical protein
MKKKRKPPPVGAFHCALLLVTLILGVAMMARGQDCTSDKPTPPSIGGGRGPDAAYRQAYQSWCERHGGNYNSTEVSCDPGPNWCKTNNASSDTGTQDLSSGLTITLAKAIISGNAQTRSTAFGIIGTLFLLKELTSEDNTPNPTVSPSQPEIDHAREVEMARQRWKSLIEDLYRNMKSTGPPISELRLKSMGSQDPDLQFKDVTGTLNTGIGGGPQSNNTLQFKSIDGKDSSTDDAHSGYGIPGLPGIYVGGPTEANAQSPGVEGLPGIYLGNGQGSTQILPNGKVVQSNPSNLPVASASAPSGVNPNAAQPGGAVAEQSAADTVSGTSQKPARETITVGGNQATAPRSGDGAQQQTANSGATGGTDEAASEKARKEFENAGAIIGYSPAKPTPAPTATTPSGDSSAVDLRGAKQQSPTVYSQDLQGSATNAAPASRDLQAVAAECAKEREAAGRFYQLKGQILEDQKEIRDLGFDVTTQQIEFWGNNGGAAPEKFKEEARELVFDGALDALKAHVGALNPVEANRLAKMFGEIGVPGDQPLNALAWFSVDHPGIIPPADVVHALWDQLDKVRDAYKVARKAGADRIFEAVRVTVGLFDGPVGFLMQEVHIVADLIYSQVLTIGEINRLTELTTTQLQELNLLTEKLRRDATAVAAVRKELAGLRPCDSTILVQGESSH